MQRTKSLDMDATKDNLCQIPPDIQRYGNQAYRDMVIVEGGVVEEESHGINSAILESSSNCTNDEKAQKWLLVHCLFTGTDF